MRQLVLRLIFRVMKRIYDDGFLQTYDGFRICDTERLDQSQRELFCTCIIEALALVKTHDKRRYRRLQDRLKYVVNSSGRGVGLYIHALQSCEIDFAKYRYIEGQDLVRLSLASTLVHEATHGVIIARGIPEGNRATSMREERLCHQEQVRFGRRAAPDIDFGPFDEAEWHESYDISRWQKVLAYVRRVREGEHPTV
jgi:hypothetical protein